MLNIKNQDHEIYYALKSELNRQKLGCEMIASENFVSRAVLEAAGSVLTNKYSEGYPRKRYYGGNEFIDICESLAIERAKKLFGAEHVNVQPHAGSQANMESYFTLLNLGDDILGMDLAHGGHLTHGSPVNFSGKFYKFHAYGVEKNGILDMDNVRKKALEIKPKLLLAGFSAYPRKLDFKYFREIADEVGCYLIADIAHIAGLCCTGVHENPVPYCDIVTTTTHKTLRGPRGAMIMSKEIDRFKPDDKKTLAKRIDSAVFPGMQGGPLDHIIAAKAVAFGEALKPEFKDYIKQVVKNAKVLADTLMGQGIDLVSDGTDNHLIMVDLTKLGVTGKDAETALDEVHIFTNKNMIPFDTRSPFNPSGIRIGTPALTTRGMKESEMKSVGENIAKVLKNINDSGIKSQVKEDIIALVQKFPLYPDMDY